MTNSIKFNISLLIFISIFCTESLSAQDTNSAEIAFFGKLPQSAKKTVQIGNETLSYEVRVIKHKKIWFVLTSDSVNIYLISYNRKDTKTTQSSNFLALGLIKLLQTGNYKVKNEVAKVDDIFFDLYFKPNRKGKKIITNLLILENPQIPKTGFFAKLFGRGSK